MLGRWCEDVVIIRGQEVELDVSLEQPATNTVYDIVPSGTINL